MNLRKIVLLSSCAGAFFTCTSVDFAYAKSGECARGEFLMSTICRKCNAGCYCSGGGTTTLSLDHKNKISNSEVESYCAHKTNSCSNSGNDGYGACGRHDSAKMYRCPDDYPSSLSGSTSSGDCYKSVGDGKIYNINVTCNAGTYLPANSNKCYKCEGGDWVCPGGTYHTMFSGYKGMEKCPSGKKPNSAKTACVDEPKETCSKGTYLPANSNKCAACPDGWVCKGGEEYDPNKTEPVDRFKERCSGKSIPNETKTACKDCAAGTKPNEDNTECVEGDAITVAPGYYLKKNSETQTACPPTMPETKYCPGGEFKFSKTEDQGQQDCPYNSKRPKGYTTKCDLTLTKEQMECGIKGIEGRKDKDSDKSRAAASCTSTPCWVKINAEDYINCVYGIRFEIGSDEEEK